MNVTTGGLVSLHLLNSGSAGASASRVYSTARFDCVLATLDAQLGDSGMGRWTQPEGGYFVSFDTLPGLAQQVVKLADDIGVKLTPAGATYPYGKDPLNSNIRLAPTFPALLDVQAAMDAFVICVQLATVQQRLQEVGDS